MWWDVMWVQCNPGKHPLKNTHNVSARSRSASGIRTAETNRSIQRLTSSAHLSWTLTLKVTYDTLTAFDWLNVSGPSRCSVTGDSVSIEVIKNTKANIEQSTFHWWQIRSGSAVPTERPVTKCDGETSHLSWAHTSFPFGQILFYITFSCELHFNETIRLDSFPVQSSPVGSQGDTFRAAAVCIAAEHFF